MVEIVIKLTWLEIYKIISFNEILQTYLASSNNATIPVANGAAAEVPVWLTVQPLLTSIVACKFKNNTQFDFIRILSATVSILLMQV